MKRLLLLFCIFFAAACDTSAPDDAPRAEPRPLTTQEARLVAADNAFTFRLLAETVADEPDANVFLSPMSASIALGMTMNGARGETRAAMETVLGKAGLTPDEIGAGYRGLLDLLPHLDPKVTFTVANALFSRDTFPVEADFIEANKRSFSAEVQALDFTDAQATAQTVNRWASTHTNGRIEKVIAPDMVGPDLVLMIANALYFKADWRFAFSKKQTRDAPFYLLGGGTAQVKMMHQEGDFGYYQGDGFSALDLPYGDSLYSLTILLPDRGRDANALVAALDAAAWQAVVDGLRPTGVAVGLPRLKLQYETFLNKPLVRMGMGLAFSPQADFTGINRQGGLLISFVKQNTFVEMDEKGTEAAAVTVVGIEVTSVPATPQFIVDRPYIVVLRERTTGAVLFAGRILNPAQ